MGCLFKRKELLCVVVWVNFLFVWILLLIALAVEFEGLEGKKADHGYNYSDILERLDRRKIVQTLPLFKHLLLNFYTVT